MLRPATPLSILLFIALVLLLISVLSVPIVKGVKLATYQGVDFGVFGYCKDSKCSKVMLGYSTDGLFKQGDQGDFSLPSSARHSLSAILIVHPIAALLTLILLILSLSAHLHAPSHSPRYLLILLILTIPTLLLSLLAFLVDLLLFVPHVQWGGWIVLAATIIIASSGIITCAMRRTLVSRKARQRRIAQNPEMNGENFRKRMDHEPTAPSFGLSPAPIVNGTPGADKLPQFTTIPAEVSPKSDGVSNDERTLLSSRNASNPGGGTNLARNESIDRFESPQRMGPGSGLGTARGYGGPVDEFGNALPQGLRRDPSDPRLRQQYSNGSLGSTNSAGLPPFSGRGRGYGPNGRGYGRGGPPPQGGFRGPTPPGMNSGGRGIGPAAGPGMMMGGAGPGMMMGGLGRGGQRGPPPGYNNWPAGRADPLSGEPSTGPGYGQRGSPGPPSAPGYRGPTPGLPDASGVFDTYGSPAGPESRPPMSQTPVGHSVRMDASSGFAQLRESDGDVRGMVDLQQGRVSPRRPSGVSSDDSAYSQP
ncbi:MAG: regulator of ime2 [Geoglossum umbratile]|nr:MAG: regulator of ime2 [Geoglossum umbratile]